MRTKKRYFLSLIILFCCFVFSYKVVAQTESDVVGKVIVGYQGWFACAGDGQPGGNNWWWHWCNNWSVIPSTSNGYGSGQLKSWPYVADYATTYQTGYSNLGNGNPAKLYSDANQSTVTTHFQWM